MSHPHAYLRDHWFAGGSGQPTPRGQLTALRLHAAALLPVSSPPIVDGAILVDDHGRIAAVGPNTAVPSPETVATIELPNQVVVPGFVNTHTHLELTYLNDRVSRPTFYDWILFIRESKQHQRDETFVDAARKGVRDGWRNGVTTVADTGDTGGAATALTELGGRGIVYQEIFGPHPDHAESAARTLEAAVDGLRDRCGPHVKVGVSPHAPYSVSADLYRRVAKMALREQLPVAIHLAESRAEVQLLATGEGAFAEAWRRRGIPVRPPRQSPVLYMEELGVLEASPLVIHAVQIDPADAQCLSRHGCAVAACPDSNREHGHGLPPLGLMATNGVRIGVGTDSIASVGSADLRPPARTVGQLLDRPSDATLSLLTLEGARALGLDSEIGSLEVGKFADLCVVECGSPVDPQTVSMTPLDRVTQTYVGGRPVFDCRSAGVDG